MYPPGAVKVFLHRQLQHLLISTTALHLQKLYDRLKDYEPRIEYRQRLDRVSRALKAGNDPSSPESTRSIGSRGIWTSLLEQKARRDSVALTRVLNSHETALELDSPKGLMLHGEVGTGKSMLIDLFADCLPTRKKKRWHFNTFMLETFARLEQLRRSQSSASDAGTSLSGDEYSLLWLARDLVKTSPILFLDEFQLPDRTASKIMANLMTGFFQLGGVLIATSNRMPDELAKAAGMEFVHPPSRLESLGWRLGLRNNRVRTGGMFAGQGEFAQFLDLLKARCDVWEMDGGRDYRRSDAEKQTSWLHNHSLTDDSAIQGVASSLVTRPPEPLPSDAPEVNLVGLPVRYFLQDTGASTSLPSGFVDAQLSATGSAYDSAERIPWLPTTLKVYGRTVLLPRTSNRVAFFTFAEICTTHFGPADYISIASTFHTLIITEIPVLTVLLKNEARRFITLLDALYEARCKLLISAAAGPDHIFFPESRRLTPVESDSETSDQDAVYPETFSEVHQDLTAPFRPNISSYAGEPDYTHARLRGILADDALEDEPPNRVRRGSSSTRDEDQQSQTIPNFGQISIITGDDERFAYKRAASRLWEMCGRKWWDRTDEGWWKPLPKEARRWELSMEEASRLDAISDTKPTGPGEGIGKTQDVNESDDDVLFKHEGSPFRSHIDPPPKISWTHVWGTGVQWGKRAGVWGQGVDGLKNRRKGRDQ